jgi:hypothetical protein
MAITYRGKSSSMASGTGSISVGVPANTAQDDILILLLQGYTGVPALPDGWTNINTSSSTNTHLRVCYKVAGASESSVTVADSGDSTRGLMLSFYGADTSSPIGNSAASTDSGTTFAATGITSTTDGSMIVTAVGFRDADAADTSNYSSWANASLASITEGHDQGDATGTGGGIAFAYGIDTTAGTVNGTTATADSSANYSAIVMFEIKSPQMITGVGFEDPDNYGLADVRDNVNRYNFGSDITVYPTQKVISYNGNLYAVIYGWNAWSGLRVFKSTDNGVTWATIATTTADNILNQIGFNTFLHGDEIYVGYWFWNEGGTEGEPALLGFKKFNLTTETWGAANISTIGRPNESAIGGQALSMAVRSNGDVVFVFPMAMETVNTVDYYRAGYAVWTASSQTWSSATSFGTGLELDITYPLICIDSHDRVHVQFNAAWSLNYANINTSNVFGNVIEYSSLAPMDSCPPIVFWDTDGKEKILISGYDWVTHEFYYKVAVVDDLPGFEGETNTGCYYDYSAGIAYIDGALHLVCRNADGRTDYYSNDTGTWHKVSTLCNASAWSYSVSAVPECNFIGALYTFNDSVSEDQVEFYQILTSNKHAYHDFGDSHAIYTGSLMFEHFYTPSAYSYLQNGDCNADVPKINSYAEANHATYELSTNYAHSGTTSLKVTAAAGGDYDNLYSMGQFESLNGFEIGKTYEASVWVYVPSGQGPVLGLIRLQVYWADASWSTINYAIAPAETFDAWHQIKVRFTIPNEGATFTQCLMEFQCLDSSTGGLTAYFDDLEITEVGHAYYQVIQEWDTVDAVNMYRSSDGYTWIAQDEANNPLETYYTASNCDVASAEDDTYIYVAYWANISSNTTLVFAKFNKTTNTWSAPVASSITRGTDSYSSNSCSIAIRSNGDIVFFIARADETVNSTPYERCGYVIYDVSTSSWGTPVTLVSGVEYHVTAISCVVDSSDRVHFHIYEDGNTAWMTLNASDVLSSLQHTGDYFPGLSVPQIYHDTSGVERIVVPLLNYSNEYVAYMTAPVADSLTFETPTTITGLSADNGVCSVGYKNGNFYAFAANYSTNFLYNDNEGGEWKLEPKVISLYGSGLIVNYNLDRAIGVGMLTHPPDEWHARPLILTDFAAFIVGVGYQDVDNYGSATIEQSETSTQEITGAGFNDVDNYGIATVSTSNTITGVGYQDTDSFGIATVLATNAITGAGFDESVDNFGVAVIIPINTVTGEGYEDLDNFGMCTLVSSYDITGVGFDDSADSFGESVVLSTYEVTGAGFEDTDNFGAAEIEIEDLSQSITGVGFEDIDNFGVAEINAIYEIIGQGYEDIDNYGEGLVSTDQTIAGVGFLDIDNYGAANILSIYYVVVTECFFSHVHYGRAVVTVSDMDITGVGFLDEDSYGVAIIGIPVYGVGYLDEDGFGVATFLPEYSVSGAGHVDIYENFGAAIITLFVEGTGHQNINNYGTAAVNMLISGQGHRDADNFGIAIVTRTVTGHGFNDQDLYGDGIVLASNIIEGNGHQDTDSYGISRISIGIIAQGFNDSDNYGEAAVLATNEITGVGYQNLNRYGNANIACDVEITGKGYQNVNNYGTATLETENIVHSYGFNDIDIHGTATITMIVTGVGYQDVDNYGNGNVTRIIVGQGFNDVDDYGAGSVEITYNIQGVRYIDVDSFGSASVDTSNTITGVGFKETNYFGNGILQASNIVICSGYEDIDNYGIAEIFAPIEGHGYLDEDSYGEASIDIEIIGTGHLDEDFYGSGTLYDGMVIIGVGFNDIDNYGIALIELLTLIIHDVTMYLTKEREVEMNLAPSITVEMILNSTRIVRFEGAEGLNMPKAVLGVGHQNINHFGRARVA